MMACMASRPSLLGSAARAGITTVVKPTNTPPRTAEPAAVAKVTVLIKVLSMRPAKVPLVERPFRAENRCVAVWVTSLFLWSVEAVVQPDGGSRVVGPSVLPMVVVEHED